jgi:gamma-glutamyltranspeptidase/glutathione hydrolase
MKTERGGTAARNRDRSPVVAQHGMACTSQPLATSAALDVLRTGGNAVDAAICANAVLGVVEPAGCGVGGDLFAQVWWEKDRRLYGLAAAGRAPADWSIAAARQLGLDRLPLFGPLSWSVPGCVSGWHSLRERFGTRSLGDLVEPAVRYSQDGFPVSPVIAHGWATVDPAAHPGWAATFAPGGRAPSFGEIFRNPDLARTLGNIARGGREAFYRGDIADAIVRYSQKVGGRFGRSDFEEHADCWIEPLSASYRGCDVWELPPPGQGIAVLQMLNILSHFDVASLEPGSADYWHLLIEVKKLVYEDRARYYADPEFAYGPVAQLLSPEYARERAGCIDLKRAASDVPAGDLPVGPDTVYLATADRHGNMVSLIQSIYHGFGSREVPRGLGFALQNRGSGFTLRDDHPNRLEPRKRPFHTIIPGFVTRKGEPTFAFGVMGGDFQPQGQVQVLLNILEFGMSVQGAGEQPRVAHFDSSTPEGEPASGGGSTGLEPGIDESVRARLAAMGHVIRPGGDVFGGYQGIWREPDPLRYFGGSDPRKDGCALGF